jgi:perosamine synthetase
MIPRFKPSVGRAELAALARHAPGAVPAFERAFAACFEAREALAFSYGRTALWAFFKALGIDDAEVVVPAYTCSVVAHAVTLSGNRCRFVDIDLTDYNMNLDEVEAAITDRTRAVVATHLFGYPLDVDRLRAIVGDAERRIGHKIWIVQDCAHAFGARWKGRLVCNEGDVALFGLNISKMMTSIFGGVLTFGDAEVAGRVRSWRDANLRRPSTLKSLQRRVYLLAAAAAFQETAYSVVRWLQDETPLLDSLAKAYHRDDLIHFPPDYADRMLDVEAAVGLVQLGRYPDFERRRQQNACYHAEQLVVPEGWQLPPIVDGATYSHYPVRVPDRQSVVRRFLGRGVQLGEVIDYSVPHLATYLGDAGTERYPNSLRCSQHTINLPIHPDLTDAQRDAVVGAVRAESLGQA